MPRLTSPVTLTPEEAAPLLGMDKYTLMRALQAGHFKDFGEAFKTNNNNECYAYEIYKYPLFTRLGLDVNLPVQEVLRLVSAGSPPWIDQTKVAAQIKKDTPTVESIVSKLMNS